MTSIMFSEAYFCPRCDTQYNIDQMLYLDEFTNLLRCPTHPSYNRKVDSRAQLVRYENSNGILTRPYIPPESLLKGPKGDKGDPGTHGKDGAKGDKGDIGLTGPQGIKGEPGQPGPEGPIGATGPQGLQGIQGVAGVKGDKGDPGSAIISDRSITPVKTSFFAGESLNLFDESTVLNGKTFDTTGPIIDDVTRWMSEQYIPVVKGDKIYVNNKTAVRVMVYDVNKAAVGNRSSTTADATVDNYQSYSVNANSAAFIRLSSTTNVVPSTLMVTKGSLILEKQTFGATTIEAKYLPKIPTTQVSGLETRFTDVNTAMDALRTELMNKMGESTNYLAPYPPRLEESAMTLVSLDSSRPLWMHEDGILVLGAQGSKAMMSLNEWGTRVQIGANLPYSVIGMRTLPDGELLASINRDDANGIRSKLYRSTGFDRNNPSVAVWTEVLALQGINANIQNNWCIDVHDNLVLVSEYGLKGETGARYAYKSTDMGKTFTVIFDQPNQVINGRPVYTDRGHVHTIAFDPYFSRIWLVVGDNPNTATYYSDDYGATWIFVPGTTVVQFTGIICLEDAVIFGSDRDPNGLYIYRRKDKGTIPKIEPWYLVNDATVITHIFNLPYRRVLDKDTPVYFTATTALTANGPSCLMGFTSGKKAFMLYEPETVYQTSGGQGIQFALGDTANGNILITIQSPLDSGAYRVVKIAAPEWK